MTTTVQAAAQWVGDHFDVTDIPDWIARAVNAGSFVFNPLDVDEQPPSAFAVTVTTGEGTAVANATDWVFLTRPEGVEGEDGYVPAVLGVATDEDFRSNYEIAA